jgi:TusA-related sulfurtransferase
MKNEFFIDISDEICPMSFVRLRQCIDKMPIGASCLVELSTGLMWHNITAGLKELGHVILAVGPMGEDLELFKTAPGCGAFSPTPCWQVPTGPKGQLLFIKGQAKAFIG